MQYKNIHPWDVSPKEAISIQKNLKSKIVFQHKKKKVNYVAGADITCFKDSNEAYAGIVVMTFPELRVVEEKGVKGQVTFPYIPGLLTFREAPILLKAFGELNIEPDLILFDGQGIAHPRGMGLAAHLGLLLNKPAIGCAKSRLTGSYDEPEKERGSFSYLYDRDGEVLGAVVRTKTNINPLFVSIGYKIDLSNSIKFALECCCGYKLPEPTRLAHNFVNRLSRDGVPNE